MEQQYNLKQRNAGFYAFFISGICAISSGIIVSILQEQLGFDYGITGTLLSLMNIGNLIAGFAAGALPGKIGMKRTVIILTFGYLAGYLIMGSVGWIPALMAAFFLTGIGKGSTLNICTNLIGDNSRDRTRGMNLMHSFYALGALLCPFLISAVAAVSEKFPMFILGILGSTLWMAFILTPMDETEKGGKQKTDWGFLKNKKFWLLTGLIFCQNAAEMSVTGWMVTYFKGSGILTGAMSAYTVTVMWTATLILRMIYAFVRPIKKPGRSMIIMGVFCTIFYFCMMQVRTQSMALILLFAFAAAMAGMNPTAVASAGKITSVTSMGIMLPAASSGAIIMPWIIGRVSESAGIEAGMTCVLVPCVGMLLFSLAVSRLKED